MTHIKKFVFLSFFLFSNIAFSQLQFSSLNSKFPIKKKKVKVLNEIDEKTKSCRSIVGLFTIYQNNKNGKSFIEIDTSHIDQEFLYFSYFENGVTDAGAVRGRYRGAKVIKIQKFYNKIDFVIENTKYFFDKDNPLSKSSKANINTPLIISEEIIATSPCKTKFLISADNIFLNESFQQVKYSYSPKYRGFKLGGINKEKTRYLKIKSYPENTDIIVNYVYESKYPPVRGGQAITDSRSVSIVLQHSLVKMPDDGYIPRLDDTRVGYFTTQSNNMTSIDQVNYRDFINKWRLEKKEPEKELSEAVNPIVYWIENTTPHDLRDIIKEGVESWNIAFEKAGFLNAIQVKVQPDSADWDAGDIRYNVLRWTSSPNPPWGGYGPSFVNPKTGEILGADIMLEWTYITNRIVADELFNESADNHHYCNAAKHHQIENLFAKNYLKSLDLSEEIEKELVKQSLYRLVLHEVGHTLGLSHNFKGSLLLSNDELNDKNIVNERGVCSSVMEYPAINIARNPENQGLFFDVKPGIYDIWAIQYGYTTFNKQEDEIDSLSEILSRSVEKELAFANDAFDMRYPGKGTDPNAMIYDLSSNPVEHSLEKIHKILTMVESLRERYIETNDTYEEFYRSYRTLLFSYYQSLNIISRQIGGVEVDLAHTDQNSLAKPFKSVEKAIQIEALNILAEYGFSNKILLSPESIPFLQKQRRGFTVSKDPNIHQLVLAYQNRLLDHLLHPKVLQRITNSSLYGNKYQISEYLIDLRKAIFEEDMYSDVSTIRQNLQISYVNRLLSIIDSDSNYDNIAKSSTYYNLDWLNSNLPINQGNLSTRQHKTYLSFIIKSNLKKHVN